MSLLTGSLQLGFLYGLLALGVYISFRVLNLPDLTADGSFTLGLAVSAALSTADLPYLGLLLAPLAGALAGMVTGLLQTKLKINPVLSGILTMSGLYTVNLAVLGDRSNVSLIGKGGAFTDAIALLPFGKETVKSIVSIVLCLVLFGALVWLFKTRLGLYIRATGDNEAMVRASSINADTTKIVALAIANACIAFSGAAIAQYQGFADISSGIGIVVVGLASVIIGETLFGQRGVTIGLLSAVAGSVVYRFAVALALKSELFPAYAFKLVAACIVIAALAVPSIKNQIQLIKIKKEAANDA